MLSALLILTELNTRLLESPRSQLNALASPLRVVAEAPYLVGSQLDNVFATHAELRRRIAVLELERLKLSQISQQFATLRTENEELRELLGSRRRVAHDVLVAEVIGVNPMPTRQQVVIDKGSAADVQVGQAVIDAEGLVGQVIAVDQLTAQVLLVADTQHAVPVVINRSGVRGIASGSGDLARLELEGVAVTADIRQGDLLVSSGLGQRFPAGYPVGLVASVQIDPTAAMARVAVQPAAALDRIRHVLVVLPPQPGGDEP